MQCVETSITCSLTMSCHPLKYLPFNLCPVAFFMPALPTTVLSAVYKDHITLADYEIHDGMGCVHCLQGQGQGQGQGQPAGRGARGGNGGAAIAAAAAVASGSTLNSRFVPPCCLSTVPPADWSCTTTSGAVLQLVAPRGCLAAACQKGCTCLLWLLLRQRGCSLLPTEHACLLSAGWLPGLC